MPLASEFAFEFGGDGASFRVRVTAPTVRHAGLVAPSLLLSTGTGTVRSSGLTASTVGPQSISAAYVYSSTATAPQVREA